MDTQKLFSLPINTATQHSLSLHKYNISIIIITIATTLAMPQSNVLDSCLLVQPSSSVNATFPSQILYKQRTIPVFLVL